MNGSAHVGEGHDDTQPDAYSRVAADIKKVLGVNLDEVLAVVPPASLMGAVRCVVSKRRGAAKNKHKHTHQNCEDEAIGQGQRALVPKQRIVLLPEALRDSKGRREDMVRS